MNVTLDGKDLGAKLLNLVQTIAQFQYKEYAKMIKHVNVTQSLVMMTAQSKFVLMTATKTEYACRNLSREFANVTKDTMV